MLFTENLPSPEIQALCPHLRALRAGYEYADEARWAERLALHPHPAAELARYPYYEHYGGIVDCEMDLLARVRPAALKHALFIGSGPLPMTAILFAQP